jgi:hypothetical protein
MTFSLSLFYLIKKSTEVVLKTPAFSNDLGQTILANVDDDTVMEPPIPSAAVFVAKSVSNMSPTQGVAAKVAEHGDNVSMEPPIPSAAVSVAKTVSNLSNSYHLYIHDETFNVSHEFFFLHATNGRHKVADIE